jgi:uncharacterized RDD family membrane protein YckC
MTTHRIPAAGSDESSAPTIPQDAAAQTAIEGAPIAPMSDRAIAAIIDIVTMSALFPAVGMWVALKWGGVVSNGFDLSGAPALFVIAVVSAIGFLYLWLGEGFFGATLGKAAMRLRVRDLAGRRPGLRKSLVRNLFRAIDGIGVYLVGLVFALTSPTRQRLGDRVAGTVVVRTQAGRASWLSAAIACAAVVFGSLGVAIVLHAGAPISAASVPHVTRAELGTGYTPDFAITGRSDTFPANQANIVCAWQVEGSTPYVPIRSVWIAEDVGSAAPPNTKLAEKAFTGSNVGEFSLTAPTAGWPVGKYRLEIYIGDTLAKSLPYTITNS